MWGGTTTNTQDCRTGEAQAEGEEEAPGFA
jgi:hypothetical protein